MVTLLLLAALHDGGKIAWRKDVDEARKDARQKGLPTMLYFTSAG
jgi:hypothetical protein